MEEVDQAPFLFALHVSFHLASNKNSRHALNEFLLITICHHTAVLCFSQMLGFLYLFPQLRQASLAFGSQIELCVERVEQFRVGQCW